MIRLSPTILAVIMLMSHFEKTTQIEPFCVTSSSNINGPSIVDFDTDCFEPGEEVSGFDLISDTFSPPYTGYYWLHFSAGLPDTGDLTDVQLALPTRTVNVQRSDGGLAIVSSRTDIAELTAGVDRLQLSSAAALFSNVPDVQVSWSGFHLDSTMSNVVAFSVAMSPGEYSGLRIPFDVVFVDTHSGWNYDRYTYTIPVTGLWVISLQIGDHPLNVYTVTTIYINNSSRFGIISYFLQGTGMNSITFVVSVNAEAVLAAGDSTVYSDINYQTAMSGFLYSPTVQPAVAWTVAPSWEERQNGPMDPVQFEVVLVNEGNGFDVTTSRFIAPHGGLYYVAMTGIAHDGFQMKMELLLNGNMKASVYYHIDNQYMSCSRAIILRLSEGDELRVRIPAGYQLINFSNAEFTLFTGFRISP